MTLHSSRAARWPGALVALLLAALACGAQAQAALRLGEIEFPTSARSAEAQRHFLRGVAALHSFWYPAARQAFQQAAQAEPDFAMAHWGEAMTHDHPVWGDPQDTAAGRAALGRIADDARLTERERGYIAAVRRLYGESDKRSRDRAYAQAMGALHERFPQDDEAKLFHALALLGTGDEAARLRAGAIALAVFERQPDHPGAAHYTIHAYDDPEHARLALPAARRYADIAPDSAHALHMPSHIFLQLGMWPEAAQANERAWRASLRWAGADGAHHGDIHSLHWLLYAYLQQGRQEDARRLLATLREALAHPTRDGSQGLAYASWTEATMRATWLIETGQWQRAAALLGAQEGGAAELSAAPATFAHGMAAAHTGSPEEALRAAQALRGLKAPEALAKLPYAARIVAAAQVQAQMIEAATAAARGDHRQALRAAHAAVDATADMPPPVGPPQLVKPPHELLGDIALAAGDAKQAWQHYRSALERHPDRARSLLGAARAAAASGDDAQAERLYERLERQWKGAALPPLRP